MLSIRSKWSDLKSACLPRISSALFANPGQPRSFTGRFMVKCLPWTHLLPATALAVLATALMPLPAAAATTISWGLANTITATNDVYTNGTTLYAYAGTATTVNGVTFTGVSSGSAWGSGVTLTSFGSYAAATFGASSASFNTLPNSYSNALTGGAYGGTAAGTVTLNGLTPGHDYAVQIWVNDSRTAGSGRYETITGSGVSLDYNNTDVVGGVGQYAVGVFAAGSTSQAFSLTPSASGSVQLNAINVRDLGSSTKTWLGTSSTSWGTPANWNPGNAPTILGDSVIFNNSSTANLATLLDVPYTLGTLTLSNTAAPVAIGNDGNTLTVSSGINLLGASQNLTISDPLVLGASQTWNVASTSILTVTNNGVAGTAALTITGGGKVSFGAPATYTGSTVISGANLTVTSGGSLASTSVSVAGSLSVGNGGTIASTNIVVATNSTFALIGNGAITGTTTFILAAGGTLDVSAESPTFALNGDTVTNTAVGAVLNGTSDFTSGTLAMLYDGVNPPFIQTNGTLTLSSSTVITVNNTGAVLLAGSYPIIAAALTGNVGSNAVSDSLPSVTLTGNGAVGPVTLAIDGSGNLNLVVGTGDIWTGASDNTWENAGNWTSGNPGGPYANPLDPVVFNNLSTANLNTTLANNILVNAVSVLNPPGAVSIGGTGTLEIGQGGINLQSASQDLTISAPLTVPNSANWNIAANRSLNINGGANGGSGPTIVGTGTVNLNSPVAFQGVTTVSSASKLKLGAVNVLSVSPGGDLAVNGLMDLQGNSQAMGGLSGSGVVDNTGASPVSLIMGTNGDSGNFSGIIQNSGGALGILVIGGNLTLNSSSNSYSGGTIFGSGATLSFPSSTAKYGTGPVVFNAGATAYTAACTFTNALFLDSAYLRVGGANNNVQTWSGPATVTNGFQMSGDGGTWSVTLSGPLNFLGTSGIAITNSGGNGPQEGYNISLYGDALTGPISGSGGITYYLNGGSSRLTVQGANTYSGGTIVNGTGNGKLNVWGAINPFSTGPVTLNAGAIIEAAPSSGTVTNALTLNGGTLQAEPQFNNYNTLTWTGPITMTADSALVQSATGALNSNQSSGVNVNGPINIGGFTLTCSSPVATYGGNTVNGSISGAGNIIENGNNVLQLNGSNTFTGTFRSTLGSIGVGNAYAMQNATLDMNAADSGAVNLNNLGAVIGALTGSRNFSLGTASVSIGNNNASTTYSGTLSGNSLIKTGTGTLTLAANAYTGNTTVNGGTLAIAQPALATNSIVTIAGGAVLELDFPGTDIVAALVLNGVVQRSGIYSSGNSGGLITGTGSIQVGYTPDVWTGALSGEWSTNLLASPKNWTSNSLAADFLAGNAVVFDDTLKSNSFVNISVSNVTPFSVTFNNNTTNYTVGGAYGIAGTAALIKGGAAAVVLTNNNTYTGNTIINSNRLTIGNAGKLGNGTYAGGIYLGSGATLEYSSSSAQTFSGPITGSGGLIKDGARSDLTLSSAGNNYTGQTIITNGRVFVTAAGNLGGGTTVVQTNQGQLYVNGNANYSNPLNLSTTGYSEGDANNNFDGAVRVDTSATLSGPITLSGNARIGNYAASGVTINLSGPISGAYSIDFYGMNNGANSRIFQLANPGNNYTGNTIVDCNDYASARTGASTTLQLGASGVIPDGNGIGMVVLNGADANHLTILEMNGFSETINGVSNVSATGSIIRNTATGTATLTIGNANTNSTFSGVITDGGAGSGKTLGITKIGTGKVTLSGQNAYNGATTVSAGTLAIGQATLSPLSTVTVAGGAVLELDFAGQNPVGALVLNGVSQPTGVYNSGNSGGLITGTGSIAVAQQAAWTGAFSSEWSINPITSPKNWKTNGLAADYANGNVVLFDDTLTGTSILNISAANVTPAGITFNNSKTNYTLQGSFGIAGPGSLTKNGTALLTILNSNTYSGATLLNAGTLEADASSALGTGLLTINGGALSNNASATLVNAVSLSAAANTVGVGSGQTLTVGGPVSNAGALSKIGAGTLALAGTNTYTGNTTISAGTLSLTGPYTGSTSGSVFAANGGSLSFNLGNGTANFYGDGYNNSMLIADGNTTGTVTLQSGTVNVNSITGGGSSGLYGSLRLGCNTASSVGTLVVSNGILNVPGRILMGANIATATGNLTMLGGTINLGTVGAGGYTGNGQGVIWGGTGTKNINLYGGTLALYSIYSTVGGAMNVTLSGGTLKAVNSNPTFTYVTGGTLNLKVSTNGLIINPASYTITVSNALTHDAGLSGADGGLTVNDSVGGGTLALAAANTYTGATTISNGTLLANNATGSGTGTGAVIINNGGTLGGAGTITGLVTNKAGGILAPGVGGSGKFTLSGNLVLLAGSTNTFAVNGSTPTNTSVALGANVTYGGVLNIVTNGTFTIGQKFTLFAGTGATNTSNFASIAGSPGAGKAFSFTNGVLSVVVGGPTLTSVTPNPTTGSSYAVNLSLTGSGFTGATAVLLTNVTSAAGASYVPVVNSDTSISVSFVPGTAAGSWNATVVNGTPTAPVPFTVIVPGVVNINPASLNAAGPGKLVLSGTGGVPGHSYAVMSSTNLTQAVWTSVATNVFNADGSFSYTNTVSPVTPSLFLRIQQ